MWQGIIRWAVLTVAVWVAAEIIPGIDYDRWQTLVLAALVLGVLNAFVKPLLSVLSLPFIIVTLGLFMLVVNAAVLGLVAWLVPGFHVAGFWPAVGGSLVVSAVGFLLGFPRRERVTRVRMAGPPPPGGGPLHGRGPPPGKGPVINV